MSHDLTKLSLIYHDESSHVFIYRGLLQHTIPVIIKEQIAASFFDINQAISEAMAMSALKHPGICTIYRCFVEEEKKGEIKSVIVMEQLEKDLMQEIEDRGKTDRYWTEKELMRFLALLVSALHTAMLKKISHRDIKPQNIFNSQDSYKLGDFGSSAISLTPNPMRLTVTGTPFFLSPELKRKYMAMMNGTDTTEYDPYKSDVYSLGLTVVFMAILRQPEGFIELPRLREVTEQCIGRLEQYPNLQPFLRKMLTESPTERISFDQLDAELSSYIASTKLATLGDPTIAGEPTAVEETAMEEEVCLQCRSVVTDRSWRSTVQTDSLPPDPYCSLNCYRIAVAPRCVGCHLTCGRGSVSLSCGDEYHSKDCLFSTLRAKSRQFTIGVNFSCPKCAMEISQKEIYRIVGEQEYDQMVQMEYSSKCSWCHEDPIYIIFDKCGHGMCKNCERTFFGKSVCRICSKLAKFVSLGSSKASS